MHPIILSGGSGTRLWPLSRPLYPKQFLALHSDKTLFQDTVLRLSTLGLQKPTIVCNEEHRFIVAENMRTIEHTPQDIILEPVGRNTAPAIAAAAISALKHDDNAVLLVLPADHVIEDVKAFAAAVKLAGDLADKGHLVTFGIKPTEAHTGYGYIESGDQIMDNSQEDLDFIRLDAKEFEKCTDISIDYAVMENTNQGAMVALDAQWSDVGSWDAVWKISEKDADNNVCQGDVITQNTKNSFIHAQDKLVCTLGLENVIVIDTQDALLVADKNNVQDIKDIVSKLKKQERKEAKHHRTVYRPWGHYDSICFGELDDLGK